MKSIKTLTKLVLLSLSIVITQFTYGQAALTGCVQTSSVNIPANSGMYQVADMNNDYYVIAFNGHASNPGTFKVYNKQTGAFVISVDYAAAYSNGLNDVLIDNNNNIYVLYEEAQSQNQSYLKKYNLNGSLLNTLLLESSANIRVGTMVLTSGGEIIYDQVYLNGASSSVSLKFVNNMQIQATQVIYTGSGLSSYRSDMDVNSNKLVFAYSYANSSGLNDQLHIKRYTYVNGSYNLAINSSKTLSNTKLDGRNMGNNNKVALRSNFEVFCSTKEQNSTLQTEIKKITANGTVSTFQSERGSVETSLNNNVLTTFPYGTTNKLKMFDASNSLIHEFALCTNVSFSGTWNDVAIATYDCNFVVSGDGTQTNSQTYHQLFSCNAPCDQPNNYFQDEPFVVCDGNYPTLSISNSIVGTPTITWMQNSSIVQNGGQTYTTSGLGTYSVTVEYAPSCIFTDNIEVTNEWCFDLGPDITVCEEDAFPNLTMNIDNPNSVYTSIYWYLNGFPTASPSGATSIAIFSPGVYTVVATNSHGQIFEDHITVSVINCDCNFSLETCVEDPCSYPNLSFPIYVTNAQGNVLSNPDFTFLWSNGFTGSVQVISPSDLPISVTVTDVNSECSESISYECEGCFPPYEKYSCQIGTKNNTHISWGDVPGAQGYEISVTFDDPACCSSVSESSPTIYSSQMSDFTVVGTFTNCFSWKVRTQCEDGSFSAWGPSQCSCGIGNGKEGPNSSDESGIDEEVMQVLAVPNPTRTYVEFRIENQTNDRETGELTIVDVTDRIVHSSTVDFNSTIKVDVQDYPAGTYLFTIDSGSKILKGKFVVSQ